VVLRRPGSAVEQAADTRRGLELQILPPEFGSDTVPGIRLSPEFGDIEAKLLGNLARELSRCLTREARELRILG